MNPSVPLSVLCGESLWKSLYGNLQSNPQMHPARIAELLAPFFAPEDGQQPSANDLIHISTYIDILLRWNARINLTAIRDPEQIVTRHFGESLFAARHLYPAGHVGPSRVGPSGRAALQGRVTDPERGGALAPAPSITLADVGSGAGFPGIPIKLWAPEISLTLIESNHKKATFLRELTRALTLTNVDIQNTRAESFPKASFDVVTLRAVERFASVLPVAANLVAPRGRLALLISHSQFPQAKTILPALNWCDPLPIPLSQSRILAIGTPGDLATSTKIVNSGTLD